MDLNISCVSVSSLTAASYSMSCGLYYLLGFCFRVFFFRFQFSHQKNVNLFDGFSMWTIFSGFLVFFLFFFISMVNGDIGSCIECFISNKIRFFSHLTKSIWIFSVVLFFSSLAFDSNDISFPFQTNVM